MQAIQLSEQIYGQNPNFDGLGAVIHISAPKKLTFGMGMQRIHFYIPQLLSCLKPASDPQKSETDLIDLPRHVKIDLDIIIIITIIIITKTMFMVLSSWQSHCESSPGSFDECRMAPSGRRPKTKPDDLRCESACTGCQKLHPPSPFIIITQPES